MADDLSIVLGVKLNEADLNSIESKLNSVVKGKKGDKIKVDLDKTINTQLANLKKSLDSITAKPYKINFQVDQSFTKEIDKITGNMKKAIEEVQKYKKEFGDSVSGNNLPAWNKVKGGFNTLKEYRDELQKQVDSYVKDLSTQGAKNIKTSISATYDKQGNATYKGLVEYENAVGKVTKAIMELDNATKTWRVNSTNVTTNYSKQAKELKDYNSLIEKHQQEITQLTSEAFNQKSPLKDQFAETANAALSKYAEALNEVKNAGNKVSDEAKINLERVRNEARIAIAEAKAGQTTARNDRPKDISSEKIVAGNDLDKQVATFERMGALTDSLRTKYDELKQSLANVNTGPQLDEWRDKLDAVKTEAQAVKSQMDLAKQTAKFEIDTRNVQTDLENVKKKYQEIIELNPDKKNIGIEEHFEKVQQAINNMNPQTISLVRAEMTGLRREVNGLQPQVTSFAQALQQSFGSIGQYISRFVSATYLLSKGIRTVKSMVNEVKAVDSSLVELQKVTDLTGSSLDQFVEKAYNVGKGLGRTGQDVIDATTTFSRAGYNLQEATKLAQSALVMTNVGVDIPNMESAASDMISILKAFDVQAEDSMEVIDKLYNVSNKQPLDFGNLTQMLVTAGGTLAQTGTTLDETMGLLTAAYATMRDTSVSNG